VHQRLMHATGQPPVCWLQRTLAALRAEMDGTVRDPLACARRRVTFCQLVGPADAALADELTRLCDDGVPADTAANLLASWYGGTVAAAIGVGLAAGGAFVPLPHTIEWRVHRGGWPLDVRASYRVSVGLGSCWSAEHGVAVVPGPFLPVLAAEGLIDACGPIVNTCHRFTGAPERDLWDRIADGFVTVLDHPGVLPSDPAGERRLAAALRIKGAPWRRAHRTRA